VVLVVDDERAARDIAGELLATAGYGVMYAANGVEAIAVATQHKIDLVVMDMMMPVMDGATAIRRLKSDATTARTPILALTGDPGSVMRQEAMDAGCDTFLLKPLNPVAFVSLVRHWLGK
jgi:CheY-like chemotaxis protein